MNAARAWFVIGIAVITYEIAAPEGQLLSEGVDRALMKHPHITRLGIAVIALHLINALPDRIDPLHQLAVSTRRR